MRKSLALLAVLVFSPILGRAQMKIHALELIDKKLPVGNSPLMLRLRRPAQIADQRPL